MKHLYSLEIAEIGNNIQDLLNNRKEKGQIIIGIAGGSGSGKTTVAKIIKRNLKKYKIRTDILKLDKFLLPKKECPQYYSTYLKKNKGNQNHPKSFDFDRMLASCKIPSKHAVRILEGHFALFWKDLRNLMDINCFIQVELNEMLERRMERALKIQYHGDREHMIAHQNECINPGYKTYILPSKKHANLVISNNAADQVERDELIGILCYTILEHLKEKKNRFAYYY